MREEFKAPDWRSTTWQSLATITGRESSVPNLVTLLAGLGQHKHVHTWVNTQHHLTEYIGYQTEMHEGNVDKSTVPVEVPTASLLIKWFPPPYFFATYCTVADWLFCSLFYSLNSFIHGYIHSCRGSKNRGRPGFKYDKRHGVINFWGVWEDEFSLKCHKSTLTMRCTASHALWLNQSRP